MPEQNVVPMLTYENGCAALDFLVRAFGFTETERWTDDQGRLSHGEVVVNGSRIFLAEGSRGYQSPKTLRAAYPPASEWSQVPYVINGAMVVVPDVDASFLRAKSKGAVILSEPADSPPGRLFRCEDVEGQRWMFLQG